MDTDQLQQRLLALEAEVADLRAQLWAGGPRLGPGRETQEEVNKRVERVVSHLLVQSAINVQPEPPPVDRIPHLLVFPERPSCHAGDYQTDRFSEHLVWRAPDLIREPSASPYRTCGYCGSMHPEDLYLWLQKPPVTLNGSDWKYGWPHKFYVEGIPNPHALAGRQVQIGSRSYPILECHACGHRPDPNVFPAPEPCERCGRDVRRHEYKVVERVNEPTMGDPPPFSYAKFYNTHLSELTDAQTFRVVTDLIFAKSQIRFSMVDGQLKYRAPHRGFQA